MRDSILELGNMLYVLIGAFTGFITAITPVAYYVYKFFKRQEDIEKSYRKIEKTMITNISCELTKLHYKAKERGYKFIWEDEAFKRSYKEYTEIYKQNSWVCKMASEYSKISFANVD